MEITHAFELISAIHEDVKQVRATQTSVQGNMTMAFTIICFMGFVLLLLISVGVIYVSVWGSTYSWVVAGVGLWIVVCWLVLGDCCAGVGDVCMGVGGVCTWAFGPGVVLV